MSRRTPRSKRSYTLFPHTARFRSPAGTPPAEMRRRTAAKGRILPVVQKGGIDNPLGARAMYLYKGGRDTIFRIHGTNQPWTIGHNMSSGCIRMMNKDVEHIYARDRKSTRLNSSH